MFCRHCGAVVGEGKYCAHCGRRVYTGLAAFRKELDRERRTFLSDKPICQGHKVADFCWGLVVARAVKGLNVNNFETYSARACASIPAVLARAEKLYMRIMAVLHDFGLDEY